MQFHNATTFKDEIHPLLDATFTRTWPLFAKPMNPWDKKEEAPPGCLSESNI
jgi:hypothetical protein